MSFFLANRKIGVNCPPLVIAEIGINHNGSLEVAIQMAKAAIDAGVEVIKHQTHLPEFEMTAEAKSVVPANDKRSIYEIIDACSLDFEEESKLKDYIENEGAIFISTPFSFEAVDHLERMDVPGYKIGSGECNNYPLVEYVASKGKPIIMSTGMNNIEMISRSVEIMRLAGVPFALLHCTSVYPTPHKLVRLGALQQLKVAFPDAVVGLSDHTLDNYSCLGAVALGADILERHFTDDKDRTGPDIEVSMDPNDLIDLIKGSKAIAQARGGDKEVLSEEAATIKFAYGSLVAREQIMKGQRFTRQNLTVRRPGSGDFGPNMFERVLGRTASVDIQKSVQIKRTHLSD